MEKNSKISTKKNTYGKLNYKFRYHLSLHEQKIMLFLISKIKPNGEDFMHQEFSVSEFCEACGLDTNSGQNYENVKDTIQELAEKKFWLMVGNNTEVLVGWINKAWIDYDSGIIMIRLDNGLRPYLLHLKERFTEYELIYALGVRL